MKKNNLPIQLLFITLFLICSFSLVIAFDSNQPEAELVFKNCMNEKPTGLNGEMPDFLINEYPWRSDMDKNSLVIAHADNGNFVLAWVDDRAGNCDIFAEQYSCDGMSLGPQFRVNDDLTGSKQYEPSISCDLSGDFVITWMDYREGYFDVYVQPYSREGVPLGGNFKVSESGQFPAVTSDGNGNFIIAWFRPGSGYSVDAAIYVQQYDRDGIALGDSIRVDDEFNSRLYAQTPAIAADSAGNFMVAWEDNQGSQAIYVQLFSSNGIPQGENCKVNQELNFFQDSPAIAATPDGTFLVVWEDNRDSFEDLYAQLYSNDGVTIGKNFQVSELELWGECREPAVSGAKNNNFMITWQDWRDGEANIYGQCCSGDGEFIGGNFNVNSEDTENIEQQRPSISSDSQGNFTVTWEVEDNDQSAVYLKRYTSNQTALGDAIELSTIFVLTPTDQTYPALSVDDSDGNFAIVWQDNRNGNWDIYAQQYLENRSICRDNYKINDDDGDSTQRFPDIAFNKQGNFMITWEDHRNEQTDIYAQLFLKAGEPLGPNFRVNDDDIASCGQWKPAITASSNGDFIITWQDERDDWLFDIYAQVYFSDGRKKNSNFKVNADSISNSQYRPAIAASDDNGYVITWCDYRNESYDIYAQRYGSDGMVLDGNFRVDDDQYGSSQHDPVVAAAKNGDFVIAWIDCRNGRKDLYAQRYGQGGIPVGTSFKVNADQLMGEASEPAISVSQLGAFIISWTHISGSDTDIYAQQFSQTGTRINDNFRITDTSYNIQSRTDVKIRENKVYNVWTDNRLDTTGCDIWANIQDWDKLATSVAAAVSPHIVSDFRISQNYPNPFNPTTTILYVLPKESFVELEVLNIRGQVVNILVKERQPAGTQQILWNATNSAGISLPSGIYFYSLKVGEHCLTKRMLLLK